MTFDQFRLFYEKYGKCPNDVGPPKKNKLNENQLRTRFEKYLKSEEKRMRSMRRLQLKSKAVQSRDLRWDEVRDEVRFRDKYECSLYRKLLQEKRFEEANFLKENAGPLFFKLDVAHIFGKGAFPHMRYDVDNLVLLNRFSHNSLDESRNPVTGVQISKDEVIEWWKFLINYKDHDRYEELRNRSINGNR